MLQPSSGFHQRRRNSRARTGGAGGLASSSIAALFITALVSLVALATLPCTMSVKRGVSGMSMRAYMVSIAGSAPNASTMRHT